MYPFNLHNNKTPLLIFLKSKPLDALQLTTQNTSPLSTKFATVQLLTKVPASVNTDVREAEDFSGTCTLPPMRLSKLWLCTELEGREAAQPDDISSFPQR